MSKLDLLIQRAINKTVKDLIRDIKPLVRQAVLDARGGPAKKAPATKRAARDMRCRAVEDGKRCSKRSKGPRFHYLCEAHVDTASPPSE